MPSITTLFSNLGLLLLVGAVFFLFVRRQTRDRGKALTAEVRREAEAAGIRYRTLDDGSTTFDEGIHHFSGNNDSIEWQAEVAYLAAEADAGLVTRRAVTQSHIRWQTRTPSLHDGALMLMNLPRGSENPKLDKEKQQGMLGGLVDAAAAIALKTYLHGHFGHQRISGLTLSARQRLPVDGLLGDCYAVWGTDPVALDRINETARAMLVEIHHEGAAILWDSQGLTIHWPLVRPNAEDISRHAKTGVRLACILRSDNEA